MKYINCDMTAKILLSLSGTYMYFNIMNRSSIFMVIKYLGLYITFAVRRGEFSMCMYIVALSDVYMSFMTVSTRACTRIQYEKLSVSIKYVHSTFLYMC